MEREILFFLLEQPRSVSDMIRELTEKELSDDAAERSDQIPRIAGNWFKKGSGYLWRLQDAGLINDVGRRYAIDRTELTTRFLDHLGVEDRFQNTDVHGDGAPVADAYEKLVTVSTWGELQDRLREEVFGGETMADLFAFETWRDGFLEPLDDGRRIASHALTADILPAVHFMLTSSVLKSRNNHIRELLEGQDRYFHWKNRRTRLNATGEVYRDRILRAMFPAATRGEDGRYSDTSVQSLADAFGSAGAVLDRDTAELLADVYLLALDDGPTLFEQYARYDHEVHLLFNLFERGWLMERSEIETDERTGNFIVPLGEVRSYLDTLAGFYTEGALVEE